jgi:hypothetical protein
MQFLSQGQARLLGRLDGIVGELALIFDFIIVAALLCLLKNVPVILCFCEKYHSLRRR